MKDTGKFGIVRIPQDILDKWQKLVNFIAQFLNLDFSFIAQVSDDNKDVQLVRITENNPLNYTNGQCFKLNGTFCERTVNEKQNIIVPNLDISPEWNPIPSKYKKIKAYLGIPLFYPDGNVFGTFCIENQEKYEFKEKEIDLMENFRLMIQAHLELIYKNHELEKLNKRIDGLKKLMTICCNCKDILGDDGKWYQIEDYILEKTGALFSHGYCDVCGEKIMDELEKI